MNVDVVEDISGRETHRLMVFVLVSVLELSESSLQQLTFFYPSKSMRARGLVFFFCMAG